MKGVRFTKAFVQLFGNINVDSLLKFLERPKIVSARLIKGKINNKISSTFIAHHPYFLAYIVAETLPFSHSPHRAQPTGRCAIMVTCTDHLNNPYFWQTYETIDTAKAVLKLLPTNITPQCFRNVDFNERQYK